MYVIQYLQLSNTYLLKHLGLLWKLIKLNKQRIIGGLISYYYIFEKSQVSKTNVVYVSLEILQICHTWKPDKTKLNLPSSPPPLTSRHPFEVSYSHWKKCHMFRCSKCIMYKRWVMNWVNFLSSFRKLHHWQPVK